MTQEQNDFLKEFRNKLLAYLVPAFVSGLLAMVAFYYQTTDAIANHEKRLDSHEIQISTKASHQNVNDLKEDVKEIRQDQKRIIEFLMKK